MTLLKMFMPSPCHLPQRDEKDRVTIMSGTEFGITLGTPIALTVPNEGNHGVLSFVEVASRRQLRS